MRTIALLVILGLHGAPALADEPKRDNDEAREKARLHNARAKRLFNLGLFGQAAVEYMKGYKAKPAPAFLFNLGQCHKRIHRRRNMEKAVFYFKSYLQNVPESPMRQEVEAEIKKLELQLKLMPAPRRPKEKKPPVVIKTTPFYKRWWFWTLVGVAVAGGAVGTAVAMQPEDETPYSTLETINLP
jgi:tetratricopeptide (TPR) repeat protein